MFPSYGDEIYRNEAGEPIGFGKPDEMEWCDQCGTYHSSAVPCPDDFDEDD